MELHREIATRWAGIPSGTYRIHALGRERDVTLDLLTGTVTMDLGGPEPAPLPDHLVHDALDRIRAVAPAAGRPDPEMVAELRVNVARAHAAGDYSCDFDSVADPDGVPDGFDCGGCSCHLSAPCHHCLNHVASDEEVAAW